MNKSRVVNKKQSDLLVTYIDDQQGRTCRRALLEVFRSSFGPNGKIQMLHNNAGGHVTLTKSSSRILGTLSVKDAVAGVITTSMQSHISRNPDGGLFVGMFSLLLVENSLKLEIHRKLLTDIYELMVNECTNCMNLNEGQIWSNLKLTDIETTLNYLRSIIQTKVVSGGLQRSDIDTLSSLFYRTFLQVYSPSKQSKQLGTIHYLTIEGAATVESQLTDGMLFEMPSIPVYMKKPLRVKYISNENQPLVRVVLVSASMSGDSDEFVDAKYEILYSENITMTVVQKLEHYVDTLINMQIGLLVCQKVIHPKLKKKCRDAGVCVIDRLGAKYIDALEELSGGKLIRSFTTKPDESFLGTLDCVKHVVLHNKSFIHFVKESGNVVTVLLCAKSEQFAEELKSTAKSCIESLERMLSDSRMLYGAGCWITVLVGKLAHNIEEKIDQHCLQLSCSKQQIYAGMETFIQSFMQVIVQLGRHGEDQMIDSVYHHFWSLPVTGKDLSQFSDKSCMCGSVRNVDGSLMLNYIAEQDRSIWVSRGRNAIDINSVYDISSCKVWDSLAVYKSGLQTAVFTANLLLTVQSFIQDIN